MFRLFASTLAAVVAAASLLSGHAFAQQPDTSGGRQIAETECAACHLVKPGETGLGRNLDAPAFQAVANLPSTNALALRVFLRSSHTAMPNIMLSDAEIDTLTAYILSLKGK